MLSVPKVIPAIAWIPPTLKILVTPQSCAVYNSSFGSFPCESGGEQRMISLHPAI